MKLYVVTWGYANNSGETANAFCGCHGLYSDKEQALAEMIKCRDTFTAEILKEVEESEGNEEMCYFAKTIGYYGSIEEERFEVDWEYNDICVEIYIKLEEKEI